MQEVEAERLKPPGQIQQVVVCQTTDTNWIGCPNRQHRPDTAGTTAIIRTHRKVSEGCGWHMAKHMPSAPPPNMPCRSVRSFHSQDKVRMEKESRVEPSLRPMKSNVTRTAEDSLYYIKELSGDTSENPRNLQVAVRARS